MSYVNQSVQKKDAKALVTGQPVYTDDIAPADCLIVKVLRSPHAHAMIEEIKTDTAKKVPGIACILTYEDVPQERFTMICGRCRSHCSRGKRESCGQGFKTHQSKI